MQQPSQQTAHLMTTCPAPYLTADFYHTMLADHIYILAILQYRRPQLSSLNVADAYWIS